MRIPYRSIWKRKKFVIFMIVCVSSILIYFGYLYEPQGIFQDAVAEIERTLHESAILRSLSRKGLDQGISTKSMMTFQTETHRATQTQADRQNIKPERNILNMSTKNFSWKTLSRTLTLYSAYYEDRHSTTGSLAILGYEMMPKTPQNLSCLVIMADSKVASEQGQAERVMIAEKWRLRIEKYRGILYKCHLTLPGKPKYVTLIHKHSKDFQNIPFTSYVPVVDVRFSEKVHKFGVCYETPLYGNKYDQEIMDSIEMNKQLGATWFTIYVYEAHEKALEILRHYSEKQKILDAVYNWGANMTNPIYNHGLTVGVHDCVYRNMYKVSYLVLCDMDEFIVPVQGFNWHELLPKIDGSKRVHFVLAHLGFHRNESKVETSLPCHKERSITYKMPIFFSLYNRSGSVVINYQQSKSIIKPKYAISVQVHRHRFMMPGYEVYFVPPNVGVMKHYRGYYHPKYRGSNFTLDYTMDHYKPAVLGALQRYYCGHDNV